MDEKEARARFLFLVEEYRMTAWVGLGKLKDPAGGEVRRNLDLARHAIDTLGMLERKTRGNLEPEEERFLRQTLTDLRLNFVDELKAAAQEPGGGAGGESAAGEGADHPSPETAAEGAGGADQARDQSAGTADEAEPGRPAGGD